MNRNFAKSVDGISIEYAPSEFDFGGVHYNATNSEEIYNAIGYYRLERTQAPIKEGFYYTSFFELENGKMVQKWEEHEEPAEQENPDADYVEAAKILLGEAE